MVLIYFITLNEFVNLAHQNELLHAHGFEGSSSTDLANNPQSHNPMLLETQSLFKINKLKNFLNERQF